MKAIKTIISSLALAAATLASARSIAQVEVVDASVDIIDERSVIVDMTIDPAAVKVGADNELLIVPTIVAADNTARLELDSLLIAGHRRYLRYERGQSAVPAGARLLKAGRGGDARVKATVAYKPWMSHSEVALEVTERGCCGKQKSATTTTWAVINIVNPEFTAADFFVDAPAKSDDKVIDVNGQAFVDYRVNRVEIDPAYRGNPKELAKIITTINDVRDNPDATILEINIKGFASPEGSYANNERLAKGRTESLLSYVMSQYDFDPKLFTTDYEAEDWGGLRDSVTILAFADKDAMMAVIDSSLAPDAKEAELRRRFPDEYAYLLREVYPALRHSDYRVSYQIKQFTDITEIARVMRERPGNLSLNEFYLLANSYEHGSRERREVFETAAGVYPSDPTSNLNAAAAAIDDGRLEAASGYLAKAGDRPETHYLKGVAAARSGDFAEARRQLSTASSFGIAQADEALRSIDAIESAKARRVTYVDRRPEAIK